MSQFEDFDLGRQLRAASGTEPDMAFARTEFTRRVKRARRRRAAAVSTSAAVVVVLFGATYAMGVRNGTTNSVTAASSPSSAPASSDAPMVTIATTDSVASTASSSVPSSIVAEGPNKASQTGGSLGSVPVTAATTVSTPAPTTGQTQPTVPKTTQPTTTQPPTTSAPTTQPPTKPVTQTFSSDGGSIIVTLQNGRLALGPVNPAPGYTEHGRDVSDDSIEVEFESDTTKWTIRVRIVGGVMSGNVDSDSNRSGGGSSSSSTTTENHD
jgi:hypothetical protein